MFRFDALPPLSLYVHFPWCVRKCPYCDFNSHRAAATVPEREYVEALLADLELDLPRVWGRRVETLFFGGGTPSLFSPDAIAQLIGGLRARLRFAPGAEITLEANPGASDAERFAGYRAAGVNRLSIGIQSFANEKLAALGRIHGRNEALAAAAAARAAGFDNFNLDLMFGLPGQSHDEAIDDLRTALALEPAHLSLYQLTLEPNTPFHAHPPALPDDESVALMQESLAAELATKGFHQYEVSAWARPGCECRHNRNYWEFGDYLGIGAGAHAKITDATGIRRFARRKQPQEYLVQAGTHAVIAEERSIAEADAGFEFMLNALRLAEGIPASLFVERTGLPLMRFEDALSTAAVRGLLVLENGRLQPTLQGRRFLNDLIALFLPEPEKKTTPTAGQVARPME